MRVLIVCIENWDTISEIPFLLKSGGCKVDVLCGKDSWLLSNKFIDNWMERLPLPEQYIDQLVAFTKIDAYDWFLLADDVIIKQINDCNLSESQLKKLLPIVSLKHRAILSSKIGLANFCLSNEIATPKYCIYNGLADIEIIASSLQFPVINKIDFSWGGANMFVSNNILDFKANLELLPENQNTMIQEYVIGEEVPIEALYFKGELLTYMSSRILQFDKGPFSLSTRRAYYNNMEVKPLLETLGEKLGITGFANIAYLKEKETGIYKLIEIDIRPNSWMAYGRFVSADFSKALIKKFNSDVSSVEDISFPEGASVEVALFFKDLRRCFWQKDYTGIFRWLFNYKKYWRFIPFYDWALFKRILKELGKIINYKIEIILHPKRKAPSI